MMLLKSLNKEFNSVTNSGSSKTTDRMTMMNDEKGVLRFFISYTPFLNFFNRLLLTTVIVLINTSITIDKALPNSTCWTTSPVNMDEIRIGNKA